MSIEIGRENFRISSKLCKNCKFCTIENLLFTVAMYMYVHMYLNFLAKLKEKPSYKMLARISNCIAEDWRKVAYELLLHKDVKIIESTDKSNSDKCLDMLIKWLETDTGATYSKLISAVYEHDNLQTAAEKIKERVLQ